MNTLVIFIISAITALSSHTIQDEDALFKNDSLDEWHIVGPKIDFTIKDGVLVGEGKEKQNSFLTSNKTYEDFILSAEVKIIRGNSGIQIRSHNKDNRLVGYQIEIDPSARAWSGGLYDEGRRAWLQPPSEENRDAFKIGEWNTYEIICVGPRIKAKVNGKVTTDFMDFVDLSGHIGFQVHSGDCKVMWRNATIVDLTQKNKVEGIALNSELKPKSLFDGISLAGMESVGGGVWSVEEGAIVGRQHKTDQTTGLMWIKEPCEEFALTLKYKIDEGNSGFFFRSEQIPNDNTGIRGIQVEVDRKPDCGGLYESGGRGWISKPTKQFSNYDEWNEMMIYTCNEHVMVWLNNNLVVDCNTSPRMEKKLDNGFKNNFAFQLHKLQDVVVRFKDIKIMQPHYLNANGQSINAFINCEYLNN